MYKITTFGGVYTVTEENHPQYSHIVMCISDEDSEPRPVEAATPMEAFIEAGYAVINVVAMSYEG